MKIKKENEGNEEAKRETPKAKATPVKIKKEVAEDAKEDTQHYKKVKKEIKEETDTAANTKGSKETAKYPPLFSSLSPHFNSPLFTLFSSSFSYFFMFSFVCNQYLISLENYHQQSQNF